MEIVVAGKKQAHELVEFMFKLIDDYGYVTVADIAELIDSPVPGHPKYGWTSIEEIELFPHKGVVHIKFPEPRDLAVA